MASVGRAWKSSMVAKWSTREEILASEASNTSVRVKNGNQGCVCNHPTFPLYSTKPLGFCCKLKKGCSEALSIDLDSASAEPYVNCINI